ncbi:MAG: phosphopantetheine-binding protein [Xanthobacteraceae bacterium]
MSAVSAPTSRDEFFLISAYVAPRTATEQKLAAIWQHALGIGSIGINDAYEDLGGSSLLAASIFAEIEKVFAIKAEMNILIEAPTVEKLAQKLDQLARAQGVG